MISYFSLFPDKCSTELRTAKFIGQDDMPKGTIVFNELFCPDLNCNCERVLIQCDQFLSETSVPKTYAMISYSWNQKPDANWRELCEDANPFLDPLHPAKEFSEKVMEFWYEMYQNDRIYRDRIHRHYRELRQAVGQQYTTKDGLGTYPEVEAILNSLIAGKMAEGSTLCMNAAEIKKNKRARQKDLQLRLSSRRKPK